MILDKMSTSLTSSIRTGDWESDYGVGELGVWGFENSRVLTDKWEVLITVLPVLDVPDSFGSLPGLRTFFWGRPWFTGVWVDLVRPRRGVVRHTGTSRN